MTINVRTHRDCRAMHGTCALKISPQDRADRARSPGCTRLVARTTCKFHPARQHATAEPGTVASMAPAASSPAQPKSIAAWRRPNSWILLGEIGGCLGRGASRGFRARPECLQENLSPIPRNCPPTRGTARSLPVAANFRAGLQPGSPHQSIEFTNIVAVATLIMPKPAFRWQS